MQGCTMQINKNSSCEILPDETVRYAPALLKSLKCHMEMEQRDQAATDPQSPARSSVLQNGQAEPMQDIGHISPKQLQDAADQDIEDNKQFQKHHRFCGAASVKVHRLNCIHAQGRADVQKHLPMPAFWQDFVAALQLCLSTQVQRSCVSMCSFALQQ